ncbi:Hsp20/alpha crystallin family protein [Advenella sp. RU8]|uniref:Hsp20/alpha crystallin family protein n=1 Tax=Advenella sp. RU8 TaxID=3399575 RepID=UPI003AB01C34
MNNLTRYENLDDLFNGFFLKPVGFPKNTPALSIKTDISEKEDAYLVKAELPGVKKEDIKVKIEGDTLSISAEVKQESEEKEGERVIHSERYYGSISRSFRLGSEIDQSTSTAKYEDGILNLELKKLSSKPSSHLMVE